METIEKRLVNLVPRNGILIVSERILEKPSIDSNLGIGVADVTKGGVIIPDTTRTYLKAKEASSPVKVLAISETCRDYSVGDFIYPMPGQGIDYFVLEGNTVGAIDEFSVMGKVADIEVYQDYIDALTLAKKEIIVKYANQIN